MKKILPSSASVFTVSAVFLGKRYFWDWGFKERVIAGEA